MPKEPTVSVEKPKQLLVEGRDEEFLFNALLEYLKIADVQVQNYRGKSRFKNFLSGFVVVPGFDNVQSMGIVRDADDSAETAFQSICGSLSGSGLLAPHQMLESVPGTPTIRVFIMPDNDQPGALEDLCLTAWENDPVMECVLDFMQCATTYASNPPNNIAKARIHAFLASREDPELRLGEAAQRRYLPWDVPAFNQLIGFLQSL